MRTLRPVPASKVLKPGLTYVLVEALDAEGNLVPLAMDKINLTVKGEGSIAGVGNGNPQSFEPFQADYVNLFYGKAMVIIQSGFSKGKINLEATAKGLEMASANIEVC